MPTRRRLTKEPSVAPCTCMPAWKTPARMGDLSRPPAPACRIPQNADLLREMISFAAEWLMELEVGALTGPSYGEKIPERLANATATANATGIPAPARLNCASRSCAPARTSRAFSSRAAWPRRRLRP
jgi:putative transposase